MALVGFLVELAANGLEPFLTPGFGCLPFGGLLLRGGFESGLGLLTRGVLLGRFLSGSFLSRRLLARRGIVGSLLPGRFGLRRLLSGGLLAGCFSPCRLRLRLRRLLPRSLLAGGFPPFCLACSVVGLLPQRRLSCCLRLLPCFAFSRLLSGDTQPFGFLPCCFGLCCQLGLPASRLLTLSCLTGRLCQCVLLSSRCLRQRGLSRGLGLRRHRPLSHSLPCRFLSSKFLAFGCLAFSLQPDRLSLLSGDLLANHRLGQRFLTQGILLRGFGLRCCQALSRSFLRRFLSSEFLTFSCLAFSLQLGCLSLRRLFTRACSTRCFLSGHLCRPRLDGRLLQGGLPGGVLQRQHLALLGRPLRCVLPLDGQPSRLGQRRLLTQRLLLSRFTQHSRLALGLPLRVLDPGGLLARRFGLYRGQPLRLSALQRSPCGGTFIRLLRGLLHSNLLRDLLA